MLSLQDFLQRCEALSEATGLAESTLSFRMFNDGSRIKAIRSGRDVGVRTLEKALEKLADMEATHKAAPDSPEAAHV